MLILPDDLIIELLYFINDDANFLLMLKNNNFPLQDKYIAWDEIHFELSMLQSQYDSTKYSWQFCKQFYTQIQNHKQYIANLPIEFFHDISPILVDWSAVSQFRKINKKWNSEEEDFVRAFRQFIDWRTFTKGRMRYFTLTFIRDNKDYIDWVWISTINDLPTSFVSEFISYLNLFVVLQHSNLGIAFVQNNYDKFKTDEDTSKSYEYKQFIFENYLEDVDADLVFDYLFDVQTYIEFDMVRVTDDYVVSFQYANDDFYGPILNNQQLWLHRGSMVCYNDTDWKKQVQFEILLHHVLCIVIFVVIILILFFLLLI